VKKAGSLAPAAFRQCRYVQSDFDRDQSVRATLDVDFLLSCGGKMTEAQR
jgi:hypothetical protein